MKLRSIYKHMEVSAREIPDGENVKIIFRHSIRNPIDFKNGSETELTNEGYNLAEDFGRNLEYTIGYVGTSSCKRNIQTVESILKGKEVSVEIKIHHDELECPQTSDFKLSDEIFKKYNYQGDVIINELLHKELPGFNSLDKAAKIMLDFMFSTGNKRETVDLYCTHDFQMAILYAALFDLKKDDDVLKKKWPMMMEGMILWGKREDFYCGWRGAVKHLLIFNNVIMK